jgi:hypothetical protein
MTLAETIIIHPHGIPKSFDISDIEPMIPNRDNNVGRKYPVKFLPLYLGSYIGFRLVGSDDSMNEFRKWLREHGGEVIDFHLLNLRDNLRETVGEIAGKPYEQITWVNEACFRTSPRQEDVVIRYSDDPTIKYVVQQNGFTSVVEFLRAVILNPQQEIKINDKIMPVANLINEKYTAATPDKTLEEKIAKLVTNAIAYYYYDFSGTNQATEQDKHIALLTARPDMLGFYSANPQDQETLKLIQETYPILRRNILDIGLYTQDQIIKLQEFINRLLEGRIRMIFGEIKSQVTAYNKDKNGKLRKVHFDRENIPKYHLIDEAHTLLAMFEFFTRILNMPAQNNIDMNHQSQTQSRSDKSLEELSKIREALIKLMNPDVKVRQRALFELRGLFGILKQNHFVLVRIYWPIIKNNLEGSLDFIEPVLEPEIDIRELDIVRVMKAMIEKAKTTFFELG